MKHITISIVLLTVLTIVFSACTKRDELPDKIYYANIVVEVANLPGTPPLEVRYQGQALGLAPLHIPGTSVVAAPNTKLAVYVKGTNQLVADTLLNLKKGGLSSYKVAYDKELGISGWINSKQIPTDSLTFQFLNNLGEFTKTHPAYDLCLYHFDFNIGDYSPKGFEIPDFQKYKLCPKTVTVPWGLDDDPISNVYYFGILRDHTTGQFITDFFQLASQPSGGAFVIYNINDAGGGISATDIAL